MGVEGFQKGERRKSLCNICWHVKQLERESQKENILEIIHLFSSLSAASRKEIVRKCGLTWISDFCSVQSLSRVRFFVTPQTTARQASLSITNSRNLPNLMSVESVMPSNHLNLCRPLLLPSVFPIIRVFSNESPLPIR